MIDPAPPCHNPYRGDPYTGRAGAFGTAYAGVDESVKHDQGREAHLLIDLCHVLPFQLYQY